MSFYQWLPAFDAVVYLAVAGGVIVLLMLARPLARSPARSWFLLVIRAAVLAILFLLLLNPVRVTQTQLPARDPEVVYLVDCSQSMALDHPQSRLQQVQQAIRQSRTLSAATSRTQVTLYRFGEDLVRVESPERLTPDDDATRLQHALEQLLGQFETLPRSVVVFSDGRATDSEHLAEIAEGYQRLKIPIHVYPVGDPHAAGDVAIQDLVAPRDAPAGSRVPIRVRLRSHGYADQRAELRIRSLTEPDRQPLATLPITLKEGEQDHELVLTQDPGAGQLVVEVPLLEGEATHANNRVPFQITSRKGKIRVLYMEGTISPHDEYSFLQNALQEDPNIECVSLLVNDQQAARPILYRVSDPNKGYPTTRAELFSYDVVICSDIARAAFTQQQLDWTVELVAQRGGGFAMVGGYTSFGSGNWDRTVWDGLIPVEITGQRGIYGQEDFRVRVPPAAERHPIWRIVDDPVRNRQILDQIPVFHGSNQAERLKPAATALGFSDRPIAGSGVMPVFSCESFGKGRTFAMTTDTTVGWGSDFERYWGEGDNRYYRKFWRNVIYWLVENSAQGNRRLQVETDKIVYRPGQPIQIKVHVYDEQLEETNRYRLAATLRAAGKRSPKQALATGPVLGESALQVSAADHAYQGQLTAPSLHAIPVSGPEAAPLRLTELEVLAFDADRVVAQTTLDVQVLDDPVEFRDPRPDRARLEELARLSGGDVFQRPEDLAALVASYPAPQAESVVSRTPAWDHLLVWLVLLGLLTLEWLCRRRWGLA